MAGKGTVSSGLEALLAIDRLEVGPPAVEENRVRMPYRLILEGDSEVRELTYRWEEPVFDPDAPSDRNLAALIGVQVALNYGLFCREIVFRGPFEEADRRFLEQMAANTAREIFVNKILLPNEFLVGEATEIEAPERPDFLQAELSFPGLEELPEPAAWNTAPDRFAVLSSGGKDSLLSYGLLEELGFEPHPVFVNESGRHWLTALNAHRYFEKREERTARVWTDSDRIFAWMLRHLPFVREDFARIRSDEYPIRLWTVAVFLFGALPLHRKRGLGRLVIGDEHDTTVRVRHRGIPHHAGLYDQSRFFDHAVTRFFLRKGWNLHQLSLLRPLSELLIEKTLAERYPELLSLQMSCHAAHKEGDRVRPCGRCEKCRRIVAMLRAVGGDPGECGYSSPQIQECLGDLVEKGLHQEREAVEHLALLLHQREAIPEPRIGERSARRHPEVVRLRFHPERSPVEELPILLRKDLYGLLLEHAEGAVRRSGRRWVPLDLERDPAMHRPYLFDRPRRGVRGDRERSVLWGELTWPRAQERLREVDIALLPVGAIEQHGPHLPLDTDSFDAEYLCRRVAEACSDPPPLVLPLIPYGVSYYHEDFAGTLSVSNETLARAVHEIGMGVARQGIRKLVIVNGHGGNAPALHFAAQRINEDAHIFTCVDTGETSDADLAELTETPNDVHAGEVETSTSLALRPELVRMEEAAPFVPSFSSGYLDFTSERAVGWYARTAKISPNGVFGDPTKASAEKGKEMWEIMVHRLVELVEHLKTLSLGQIYQRKP